MMVEVWTPTGKDWKMSRSGTGITSFMMLCLLCAGLADRLPAAEEPAAAKPAGGEGITAADCNFWSFRHLARLAQPTVQEGAAAMPIDSFLLSRLEARGLGFSPPADRATLIRRASFDLVGLPPSPEEVQAFVADDNPDAYHRLIERLLASPRYGERWGRHWLDVVGYSDSNGYHRADTPRPLAWRYRDYVIRSFNNDKPYDRFWLEQLAGDELVKPEQLAEYSPEVVELLVATHFLRNAPDGTDSTEGNEIARTIERYAVLEQQLQITISALFGLTIDCARCHDHKFDPIPQSDYYSLQAVLYPAFNVKKWTNPKDRLIQLAPRGEIMEWEAAVQRHDREIEQLKQDFAAWVAANRPTGQVVFRDDFDQAPSLLAGRWSNTAPGDDAPAGTLGVNVDSPKAPGAQIVEQKLHVIEAGANSSGWLVTKDKFDWTPDRDGAWVQATFDLVSDRLPAQAAAAERIGYYISLHDYNGNSGVPGGNVLFDGNPAGGAAVSVAYPGPRAQDRGKIGASGYKPGHKYGVRVTNAGKGQFRIEQLVDWVAEEPAITLATADLPDGGFGFEFCCGRSFVVDNVSIETGDSATAPTAATEFVKQLPVKREELAAALKAKDKARPEKPGQIAWVTDLTPEPPLVPLLKRGRYFDAGPAVDAGGLDVLREPGEKLDVVPPEAQARTTGRRLAFARWATRADSRAAALVARVQVNRVWMWHFGRGLVETPENFGARGLPPSHPELLEWLAARFVDSGWSTKMLHREIMLSDAYRQGTRPTPEVHAVDPDNRLLWAFPVTRLESEAVRDAMLFAAAALDTRMGGPAIDFEKTPQGQSYVPADENHDPSSKSGRSVYLRDRRSEPITFLQTFDRAAAEPNCVRRSSATVVSQALAMLNSRFVNAMAERFAGRITRESPSGAGDQIRRAYLVALNRLPTADEVGEATGFLSAQATRYRDAGKTETEAATAALTDFCQVLLASNEFLYVR